MRHKTFERERGNYITEGDVIDKSLVIAKRIQLKYIINIQIQQGRWSEDTKINILGFFVFFFF